MRMHTYLSTIPILIISTQAIQSSEKQLPTRLPKVVVSAAALGDPCPLDNAAKTRITAKELAQQQAVTLGDALRRVPGAYVSQGGIGQESRVSLRGTGDANTTVIVNGMAINDSGAFDEAVNLSRWTLDDVSEIQVIRGPMSSLYGPSGIGGVVLIETKKGEGPHKIFGKAEGGSFSTFSQNIGMQGERNLFDYHVSASRLQSSGTSITPDRLLPQLQEKAKNPLHQENITTRFGVGSESAHISLFSRYLTRRLGFRPSPIDSVPWRQNFSETFNRLQGHFEADSGRWVHDIGLGYYQNDLTNTHPIMKSITRNGSQAQVDWRQTYEATSKLQIQLSTDYSHEKLYWSKPLIFLTKFETSHGGFGGVLTYRLFEHFMVTGAARIDKYQGIPSAITYRLGSQYSIKKVTIKGGIGTAFKAPTLQQRFYKDPFFSGNPYLKPEKSLGWDVGIERSLFQRRFIVGVTFFQNRIHDLISSSPDFRSLINVNKSRTQGFEGIVRIHPVPDWTLELGHTYIQAWDEKTKIGLIGNPRNKTTLTLIAPLTSQWQVSGNVRYISARDTFDAVTYSRVKTPSYTILGLETSYKLNDQWQVYGRGENILNRHYQNPRSYQQPGLGVYVGMRAQC